MEISMKKRVLAIGIGVLLLLSIPFTAMQITNEVQWSGFDFVVAGCLLFLVGISINFILMKAKNFSSKVLYIMAALFLFTLIWLELAVGIFGTPFAGS